MSEISGGIQQSKNVVFQWFLESIFTQNIMFMWRKAEVQDTRRYHVPNTTLVFSPLDPYLKLIKPVQYFTSFLQASSSHQAA
jgi:hypothetical protein